MATSGDRMEVVADVLVDGTASGPVLSLAEPLSFWGGFELESGRIIDQHHANVGVSLSGTVLLMTSGRGSSSGSSVLAEAIRAGTAPAAIVMAQRDEIVALGAIVADELYQVAMPTLVLRSDTLSQLAGYARVEIVPGGIIRAE